MMDIDRSAFGPDTTTDEVVDGLDLSDLSVLITGASVLASICLLSLYVGQIFHEVKLRPRYLVGERTDEAAVPRPLSGECAHPRKRSRPLIRMTRPRPRAGAGRRRGSRRTSP